MDINDNNGADGDVGGMDDGDDNWDDQEEEEEEPREETEETLRSGGGTDGTGTKMIEGERVRMGDLRGSKMCWTNFANCIIKDITWNPGCMYASLN